MNQEVREQFLRPEIGLESMLNSLIQLPTSQKITGKVLQHNSIHGNAMTRETIVRDARALLKRLVPPVQKEVSTSTIEQEPATPTIDHPDLGPNRMIINSNQDYSDRYEHPLEFPTNAPS